MFDTKSYSQIRHSGLLGRFARIVLLVVAILGIGLPVAHAQSGPERRFPHSQITAAEWQTFLNEVKAKPGVRDVSHLEQPDILALDVDSEKTIYFFTNGGPAHPSVVVETVVQDSKGVSLRHTGYFAGSEAAFAKWFDGFKARADAIREGMKGAH